MVNRERLINTFLELVQVDSPSGEEEAVAQLLMRKLGELGLSTRRDGYGNVIATSGTGQPLLLSAHMDTVQPGHGVKPQIQGDRIVSDGTTVLGGDPKAGVAGILEGLATAQESGPLPAVQVVLTRQEEIGLVGAHNLDYSLVQAKEGVVFDGEGPVNRVTNSAPTALVISVEVTGRAAHAGVEPEKGVSAIKPMADLVGRLPQGRLDQQTTANVGVIQGGTVFNAVPEHASLQAEMRSRDPETFRRLRGEIEESIAQVKTLYPEASILDTLEQEFDGYTLPEDHPAMQRVLGALRAVGLKPQVGPSGGGTDTNIMYVRGIIAPVVGMADGNAHTVREYVEIPQLVDVARFCAEMVRSYRSS